MAHHTRGRVFADGSRILHWNDADDWCDASEPAMGQRSMQFENYSSGLHLCLRLAIALLVDLVEAMGRAGVLPRTAEDMRDEHDEAASEAWTLLQNLDGVVARKSLLPEPKEPSRS